MIKRLIFIITRDFFAWIFCRHEWEKLDELHSKDHGTLLEFYKCKKCGVKKVKNCSLKFTIPYLKLSDIFLYWEAGFMTDEEMYEFFSSKDMDIHKLLGNVKERVQKALKKN